MLWLSKVQKRLLHHSQRLGKALMLPVSVLPAAAILMGIGYWMDPQGFGENRALAMYLIQVGLVILENIPLLFAVGVALGLSRNQDGAAALSGLVGYLVVVRILAPETVAHLLEMEMDGVHPAFHRIGNQFIGILSGVVAATLYNRYHRIRLPAGFGFFGGRRFIPIITAAVMSFISLLLLYLWPVTYEALVVLGVHISRLGAFGAGLYGFLNRMLLPLSLHHPLNSVFWFDVIGINDIGKFWSSTGVLGETGRYMAGFFPVMMFGLPAAALAMAVSARPGRKKTTRSLMAAAALASFLTGITEPLEFAFLFAAPQLYVIHALLTGLSLYLAAQFGWMAGFGFSAGLTDFLLSLRMPLSQNMHMLLLLGVLFGALYYFTFRHAILRWDLSTPGREQETDREDSMGQSLYSRNYRRVARTVVRGVGGVSNIMSSDACITRLRLTVKDAGRINERTLRSIGAVALRKNGLDLEIIIGPQVGFLLEEVRGIQNAGEADA